MCVPLPEYNPQRQWHGYDAQHQVGQRQNHDEVVARRPHDALAQDGVKNHKIADDSDEDNDAVEEAEQVVRHLGDALPLAELLLEILQHLVNVAAGVVAAAKENENSIALLTFSDYFLSLTC